MVMESSKPQVAISPIIYRNKNTYRIYTYFMIYSVAHLKLMSKQNDEENEKQIDP